MYISILYMCVCVCVCVQVKRLLVKDNGGKPLQVHQRLFAGSIAGVSAQTTIYPMEVTCAHIHMLTLLASFPGLLPLLCDSSI